MSRLAAAYRADAPVTASLHDEITTMDFGKGAGHTGFVRGIRGGKLVTIEGNTNTGGSREGIGVFERTGRTLRTINKGFIDYAPL